MSGFVDECRREWKRLHVPAQAADEMAAELAADLAEAEAEGVSEAEVLGTGASDPRAFAASLAREHGLIKPRKLNRPRTRGALIALVGAAIALAIASLIVALLAFNGRSSSSTTTAVSPTVVFVPDLLYIRRDLAVRKAQDSGLDVRIVLRPRQGHPRGTVVDQRPTAGAKVAPGSTLSLGIAR